MGKFGNLGRISIIHPYALRFGNNLNNFFFSPRNCAAFVSRRAVARRKRKLFQYGYFHSRKENTVNYGDAPEISPLRKRMKYETMSPDLDRKEGSP